jgi:hypothetical protein
MQGFVSAEMLHTVLILFMVALLIARRSMGRRDMLFRIKIDRVGLRAALRAELASLEAALALNASLLVTGHPHGFPGKPFFAIYRGNISRILLLTEPEIAAVVAVQGASDALDAAMALTARSRMGPNRALEAPDGTALHASQAGHAGHIDIEALQAGAEQRVRDAMAALEIGAVEPPPPPTWRERMADRFAAFRAGLRTR